MTDGDRWRIIAYDRIADIYRLLVNCCYGTRPILGYSDDEQYRVTCPICQRTTGWYDRKNTPEMIEAWNEGRNHESV
jgi:hypothetical protein